MQSSSFEKAIRLQFDCLIRKVIDCTVKNYNREIGRHAKHERPFCDVPEIEGLVSNYIAAQFNHRKIPVMNPT